PNGCPSVTKEIQLKTGVKSTLTNSSVTKDVCDLNLDNSEAVNLSDYLSFFTAAPGTAVTYFNTMSDAQNNQNPVTANKTITADRSFFYRITVPGSCANIGTLNLKLSAGTPSTTLPSTVNVCQGATTTLNVGTGYTAISWSTGATTSTINAGAGTYWVDLTNASGCVYRQTVTVVDSPKPQWNITAYNAINCDENFDGIINVKFSAITTLIIQNAALFTVEYSLFSDFRTILPNDWTYAADTTVFVRAYSTVCPAEVKQIDLKIGNTLPLISITQTVTVCDNDANGTENINLATYRNLFTTDAAATVRYFATLANAQANTPTINAAQSLTGNKTFYYRFSKAGFCDVIGTLNLELKAATPTALLDSYTVCQGSSIILNAESSYTAWLWRKGTTTVSTTQTAVLTAGVYTVSFTNASGCVFTKTITVTDSSKPQWNITAYNAVNCDDNFDGIINVKFATITPLIIQNAALFTVEYSLFSDFRTLLPNDWSYNTNTPVFVRAYSTVCPAEVKQIDFKVGNSLPLLHASAAVKVCDDDSDAVKSVNLANYLKEFTADSGVTASYYLTLADAQNNVNGISNQVSVSGTATYYLRFHKNNFCDVIGQLTVNVQIPKKSTELADKQICPGTTTVLDAGPGFDAYLWSTGATTSSVTVPVGNYWVDLTHNGCTYRQTVSVTAVSLPEITSVQIQGSTVTVTATGGNPPYQYAIDGGTYQSSNIFTNVRGGDHIISVISADNCSPVTATINVIELYNAITPNGDGINDVLNYSALLQKEEPFLQIFDRYGKLVFTGDQNNRFTWDGRIGGKGVGTGTFWYVMSWKEPGFTAVTEYSGWVLVKNRE
ncbi:T9SS type B sorting domain-containing protein, partial [Kaistella sp.]|uniref:T9SS type B sorting domain-containing protein n=1 Tax=Kaistella sp. TaxID=2782235 RepID=UPI002F9354E0